MGTAVNYQGLDENQLTKTSQPDNIKNFEMPISAGEKAKKYNEKNKLTDAEFLVKIAETVVPRSAMLLDIQGDF